MLLTSRRRRATAQATAAATAGTANGAESGRAGVVWWSPLDSRARGLRRVVVSVVAAVVVVAAVLTLNDPGGPLGRIGSFGGQLLLVPLAGVLWWRRRRRDAVLAWLVLAGCVAWTLSTGSVTLAIAIPGRQPGLARLMEIASPLGSFMGLAGMAWLCRGRGRRLSPVRIAQGTGLLILLAACCWVLLLGSGEVLADLPASGRPVVLTYLAAYLASLALSWYALFRRRSESIPGLGQLCLAQAVGAGATTLSAVRMLDGGYSFGDPIEIGWVASGGLLATAAVARAIPSQVWERRRQRAALVGVLLLAAASMAMGVIGYFDHAVNRQEAQHDRAALLRGATAEVIDMTNLRTEAAWPARSEQDERLLARYQGLVSAHARGARDLLGRAAEMSAADGRDEQATFERLRGNVDAYEIALRMNPVTPHALPSRVTTERGERLIRALHEVIERGERQHVEGLAQVRRITGLMQLAVPIALLVAGLTFVSSWSTLAKRERLLQQAEARKQLTKAVVHAQERERGRIAADLHDGPLQQVAAWRIKVEMVLRKLDRDPAYARELLASLDQEVAQQAVELRRLMHALRPPVLDELGLEAAIEVLARDAATRSGVKIKLDARIDGLRCGTEVETLAYRIVQEGMTNVAKHSAAATAVIGLLADDGGLLVRIVDDGRGMREFAPDQLVREGHFGLAGISERVEIVGGRLRVLTANGGGTTLEAWLPGQLGTNEE